MSASLRQVSRWISMFILLALFIIVAFFAFPREKFFRTDIRPASALQTPRNQSMSEPKLTQPPYRQNGSNGKRDQSQPDKIPEYLIIDIPFSTQAPFANWSQPWQDACEETSVLMAIAWARGFSLSPSFAAEEILKQVAFEERTFGDHRDTSVADTARLIKDFYRYQNFEIRKTGVTETGIKEELRKGNIAIVPLAGALLENPHFISPPHYHMAVIRGYDDRTKEFIVNEPGTKHGNMFRYRYENLISAIHDWTGSAAAVLEGEKTMIIVTSIKPPVVQYLRSPL